MSEFLRYDRADFLGTITSAATFIPQSNQLSREGVQALDCRYFNTLTLQLSGTWVGTVVWEISNNGTDWVGAYAITAATGAVTLNTTANGVFILPVSTKFVRVRCSAYTSGTIVGTANLSTVSPYVNQTGMAVAVTNVALTGSASYGHSSFAHIMSAASTNATSVKGSAGSVGSITVGNNGATVAYLKLYNKATAPTVGTDTPVSTILIPVGGTVSIELGTAMRFATGIGYAITGGAAVADTTAVAASQVVGHINYT